MADEEVKQEPEIKFHTPEQIASGSLDAPTESSNSWDINKLPKVYVSMKDDGIPDEYIKGVNNVEALNKEFYQFLIKSKRINSENTRSSYEWNAKQFLIWCNQIQYDIRKCQDTKELTGIAIAFNRTLEKTYSERNTIALKMMSVKKFWHYINFQEQKLDIGSAFNADWITTMDGNAFKKQIRISDQLYDEIVAYVNESGTYDEKWILYFLAWGCRRSEAADARVENIDMANKWIQVYMQKTGDFKKLPLPDWFTSLSVFDPSQIFIITCESNRTKEHRGKRKVSTKHIWRVVRKWLTHTSFNEKVKIAPHAFRRYFASSMIRAGFSDSAIAKITGHRSLQMIQKYGYDEDVSSNPIVTKKAVKY